MKKIAVVGLDKNNVWDFFNNIKKSFSDVEFIPYISSNKDEQLYERLADNGFKPDDFSAAISVGGDGTFLYTSRVFAGYDVPIFGINKGHLGFNTNIEEVEFSNYFKEFLSGKAEYEYKTMIDVVFPDNKETHVVLNEGVISYTGISRTVRIKVSIGENPVCNFRGDGLIISSPTGSTAYNLSAGGPILHPSVCAFVVCPICPMTLAIRPYIIPYSEEINIIVEDPFSQVTLDGQKIVYLKEGEKVLFKKSEKRVKIIKGSSSFSEILKTKLGWVV